MHESPLSELTRGVIHVAATALARVPEGLLVLCYHTDTALLAHSGVMALVGHALLSTLMSLP